LGQIGKKAFFFTFLAMVLLTIFIVVFTYKPIDMPGTTIYSEQAQIRVLNEFSIDVKDVFLPRALWASTREAINKLNAEVKNGPIDDFEFRMTELITEGKYMGVPVPEMENKTLYNYSNKMEQLAWRNFRIRTNISFYTVRVYQENPWSFSVSVENNILNNMSGITYNLNGIIYANISIEGFDDPLFAANGLARKIVQTQPAKWNESTIIQQIQDGTFRYADSAPSFIMRMENTIGPSQCCGIVSLMNSSFPDVPLSYVDYNYFSAVDFCPNTLFNITNVWDDPSGVGFKIDGPNLFMYGFYDDGVNATQIIC